MKQHQYLTVPAALMVVMMLFGIGCAKENSASIAPGPIDPGAVTPTTGGNNGGGNRDTDVDRNDPQWTEGGTAALISIDDWVFRNMYAVTRPLNNPTDLRISVKVGDNGSGKYPGRVLISFLDNGQYSTARFVTQNATIPSGVSHGHTGKNHAEYNRWFAYGGSQVYRGFYEDDKGAVLLIIDGSTSQGDGGGSAELSGEIWIKNYGVVPVNNYDQREIPCWFVEGGPYECRTYLTDRETVATSGALYPTQSTYWYGTDWIPSEAPRGWRRLARFQGLSRSRAFGQ
jgi:hypothetical protein